MQDCGQWRRHGVHWGGHVHPTFARGRSDEFLQQGRGPLRLQTPVIAMSVHPTYFDLATPLTVAYL